MSETTPLPSEKPKKLRWPSLLLLNFLLFAGVIALAFRTVEKFRKPYQGLNPIVAKVNHRPIYARDLLSAAQLIRKMPDARQLRMALDRLIREEIVAQQLPKTDATPVNIDELLETLGFQFNDAAKRSEALTVAGLSESDLRTRLIRQIRIGNWLRQAAAGQPSEADCRSWFQSHPEIAAMPEVVQATHFAAIFPPHGTPEELLGKGDLLRDAQSRLKEGIPFPQLIDAFSDDPAKKITHGSLFWFRRERMEPPLVEAAFAQPLNEIGKPVETRFGFHLLLVTAHSPAATLTYEQVADEVRQRCRAEQERKKIDSIVTDLLQRAKVDILDSTLRNITL